MTGQGEIIDKFAPEGEGEPTFQYTDLTFADDANQTHYEQFQKVLNTAKQSQINWHKKGLDELKKQAR